MFGTIRQFWLRSAVLCWGDQTCSSCGSEGPRRLLKGGQLYMRVKEEEDQEVECNAYCCEEVNTTDAQKSESRLSAGWLCPVIPLPSQWDNFDVPNQLAFRLRGERARSFGAVVLVQSFKSQSRHSEPKPRHPTSLVEPSSNSWPSECQLALLTNPFATPPCVLNDIAWHRDIEQEALAQ